MSINVKVYPYGLLQENTYLVTDEATGLKAVIDPGYFGDSILNDIGGSESLKYVILTHGHFDHFNEAISYTEKFTSCDFIAPVWEKYLIEKDWSCEMMTSGYNTNNCPEPDIYVDESTIIRLGESEFRFIHTPGHTEGGMCVLCNNVLFSGDTLFKLSVGNTCFETGSWDELIRSIQTKLYVIDDDTIVYPGHGDATTIGYEKRANPFV